MCYMWAACFALLETHRLLANKFIRNDKRRAVSTPSASPPDPPSASRSSSAAFSASPSRAAADGVVV